MKIPMLPTATAMALTMVVASGVQAAEHGEMKSALAQVSNADGDAIGTVEFSQTAGGAMLVDFSLDGIAPGVHGVHVHETGDCSSPDFKSAGGHLSGDAMHGVLSVGGPHPGDFPNVRVGEDGALRVEYFNERLTMDMLGDEDGAAVIVHAGADDYTSQPAGDAGSRIACGVIGIGG